MESRPSIPPAALAEARDARDGDGSNAVDYDVHGLARIRLVDASASDLAAVTRQLGPVQAPLAGEPDIVVRFVERLPASGPVRYIGLEEAGFTDDAFLVLRGTHKSRVRVQIPLDDVGRRCELVCETGLPAVPLLIPILNLTVLAKGIVPVHAAAFVYEGTGVLVTGWAKGGKTETLLAFMSNGADYVGDEWVYLDADGEKAYGVPEPIKIWDWHLPDLPEYRARLGWRRRSRLAALKGARAAGHATERASRGRTPRLVARGMPLLERQLYTHVHPEKLFGRESCVLAGSVDKVFFVVSAEREDVAVEEIDAEEVARRMVFSLQHEQLDFLSYYLRFRFAFPDISNPLIEGSEEAQRDLLARALRGKEAYLVSHPFPASIPALFDATASVL